MSQMESGKRKNSPLSNEPDEKRLRTTVNGDVEEPNQLSEFELLPLEIKLMLLQYVFDGVSTHSEHERFWGMKLVNREFNSILSSDYAKRHFQLSTPYLKGTAKYPLPVQQDCTCGRCSDLSDECYVRIIQNVFYNFFMGFTR
ncbi:unnamed protein product [Auanema sp. JU1783]|nr:unnamed protein product [Auanema sp. JU1783]